jgi:hypothetical protein
MDITRVINIIRGLDFADLDMRLYFTRKRPIGRYQSYSPTIHPELQREFLHLVTMAIEGAQEAEQRPFSPIGSIEGCIETYFTDEVASFHEILDSMNDEVVSRGEIPTEEISKLTFYCLKVFTTDGEILFFRRVTKFNRLNRGGFFGRFTDGDFRKLDDTLLGIVPDVDIVIFDGEMLILNHVSLERIFSIQDQYHEKASQTLDLVRRANRINNFDQFYEDCLSDGRVTRALTKLLNEEDRMHQVFENFENVISVIDIFDLNIEVAEENTRLVYEDKSQLLDITRLMRDSFYSTLINNRNGFDEGV